MELPTLAHLAIALGLGLLVGLEREWAGSPIAGIRTFPMITLFGTLAAMLAPRFGGWIVPAALLALSVILVVAAPRRREATYAARSARPARRGARRKMPAPRPSWSSPP